MSAPQGDTAEAEECNEPRGYIPTDAEKHLNSNMKFICIEISDILSLSGYIPKGKTFE